MLHPQPHDSASGRDRTVGRREPDLTFIAFDIEQLLGVQTTVRLCLFVGACEVAALLVLRGSLPVWLLTLLVAALLIPAVRTLYHAVGGVLAALELVAAGVLALAVASLSVETLVRQRQQPESIILLVLAVSLSVWALNGLRRFMYPAAEDPIEYASVSEVLHGDMERRTVPASYKGRRLAVVQFISLISIVTLIRPLQRQYLLVMLALATAGWESAWVYPALRRLIAGERGRLFRACLAGRAHRIRRSYLWFLLRHGGNRLRAYLLLATTGLSWSGVFLVPLVVTYLPPEIGKFAPDNVLVTIGLVTLGYYLYRKALFSLAAGVTEAQAREVSESSNFNLYLRSFSDDPVHLDFASSGWRRLLAAGVSDKTLSIFRSIRVEEFLARATWPSRPLVAVAPSRSTGDVGALRLQLSEENWGESVVTLARRAQSVLLVAGDTPGLTWELKQLSADPDVRQKLCLLFPPLREDYRLGRWNACFGNGTAVPSSVVHRAVAAQFLPENRVAVLTAPKATPPAYRLALRLAEWPELGRLVTSNS